jgi:two-component system chemotaxis response regulator CheB
MPAGRDLIVVGASAGGVPVLSELLQGLPADLSASVVVVVHTSPTSPGVLPQILDRAGQIPVQRATDGEILECGRVYVAPPDHHLLITDNRIHLSRGPRENGFRPAVDPLFRSAARSYGPRVIGVVVSGGLDDGTQGLLLIKRYGGIAIVQDPNEAMFNSMPLSAMQNVEVDRVLPIKEIPAALVHYVKSTPVAKGAMAATEAPKMLLMSAMTRSRATPFPARLRR